MRAISYNINSRRRRSSLSPFNTHSFHFSSSGYASEAILHLRRGHQPHGLPVDSDQITIDANARKQESLISLIRSSSHNAHLLQIHAHLFRTSLLQNPIVSLAFLSRVSLSHSRNLGYCERIFARISKPNVSHYNTMIRAYSRSDSPERGFELYREMLCLGIRPDPLSSSFVAKSCAKRSSLSRGLQIHARVLRDGHQSDILLLTTLMDLYSSCLRFNETCQLFDEMPQRDTVAWNVLISCYIRNRRTRDALAVFDEMQNSGSKSQPDDVTCLLLLQACTNLNALEFGKRIHNYILEHKFDKAVNLSNSLISMYSRCGCLNKAYEVFQSMSKKDVVSWTAMITGFASNGYGREAIKAFEEMQRARVPPDDQTFTGILSACSHSGLLEKGRTYFDSMTKDFGISPNIHHYGCMVDLMGRSGLLDEAYRLINSMKIEPDPTIWRTLLSSCRIHCHVNLGERVIGHLIELKAEVAGDYVLLLNIYSSVGDWEKVIELRKKMKDNQIQTTPGCSTIEIKGEIHEFLADDVSHRRKNEVYRILVEIKSQLKIGGYVAEITSELHNLGCDEEKGMVLSCHSEKLAIAFGVLETPPGTTLRVAKNLRTCIDCHNFAKVFSSVYNREVIVRDRTRFHHFRDGRCSCGDYW